MPNSFARLRSVTTINNDDTQMANGENPSIGVVQITDKRQAELVAECRKRPYLDGRFFEPDLSIPTVNGIIVGICQLCKAKSIHRPIKGSFQTLSNYTTHIQVNNLTCLIPNSNLNLELLKELDVLGVQLSLYFNWNQKFIIEIHISE